MKVVCVDDTAIYEWRWVDFPNGRVIKGETYTVTRAETGVNGTGYIIAEKPIRFEGATKECGWRAERFVPLHYYSAEFSISESNANPVKSF